MHNIYLHTCANCGSRIRRTRQHTNAAWYKRNRIEMPLAQPISWWSTNGHWSCSVAPYGQGHDRKWHDSDQRHVPAMFS